MLNEKDAAAMHMGDVVARRGIFYQAFSIYKEVGGFYDYGPIGLRIKKNIENIWRELFVYGLGMLEVETTTILPEVVLKASGHLGTFTDPMVRCTACNAPFRADKLLEEMYAKSSENEKEDSVKRMTRAEMQEALTAGKARCQRCGGGLSGIEEFNLLFATAIGPMGGEKGYLRPETAQGIFVDFKSIIGSYPMKLPFGISQVGKVYRNEISPRQQLVRLREFSQMEAEVFVDPSEDHESINGISLRSGRVVDRKVRFMDAGADREREATIGQLLSEGKIPHGIFALLVSAECDLMERLGIGYLKYRFREIEKADLPHYSKGNVDLEIATEYGYVEVAGNAHRTDFDLGAHSRESGKSLSVVENGAHILPHVIEASIGLDRLFLAVMENALIDDKERGWKWLRLSGDVAPYRYAIFPLQKDAGLVQKSREIADMLTKKKERAYYSETGSIGKRYARADEVGVPFCITVDYQTLEDGTVTIRDRDTTGQTRVEAGAIL